MKIVKIYGGLGNQMFQYAFARSLSASCGDAIFLDSSSLDDDRVHNGFELGRAFDPRIPEAPRDAIARLSTKPDGLINRFRRKYFTKPSHVLDKKFGYQPELLRLQGDVYYEGYWQSEKYFKPWESEVREGFAFRNGLSDRNRTLLASLERPIVSVHVRRGDYLKYPNLDICTPAYYERAAQAMTAKVKAGAFLVFSDDAEYCRRSIRLEGAPISIVDWNAGTESWQDMAMMAECDHHIIANSSFSWWGAWLDPRPTKRIIAPSVWNRREIKDTDHYYSFTFADIVPDSWERVAI